MEPTTQELIKQDVLQLLKTCQEENADFLVLLHEYWKDVVVHLRLISDEEMHTLCNEVILADRERRRNIIV